ncbi:MAG: C4-dicarboxylate TRAP transporter substrate-binding protein [Betaproteobacteria bacterium]|jgi:tripartite ATP-independent transporter DctP family solute receptor|nr:DctP family TRAP transporter solute-binding subunit [Betaproteobacteria bacterium]NBT69720.1 DctP family TRAP transporter solute-binding subunit [Betaproteobacteria bacterium]NBY07956.1 DctP family TRAP transporter solute-binding subunit [Betaproteobacteria bacterium]
MKRRDFTTLVAASAIGGASIAQETIRIRLAHSLSTSEPAHLAAEFFAKNVAQRSNNRVQIQVFPGEQLGSGKDVNEMIRQGANVMNITDPGYLSDFVPDIGVLNGPYLINDPKDYNKLLASDWYKGTEKKLETAGFRLVMANGFFGQRHLISTKAVRKPEDMNGMTVRVPPNTMWIETFKAMGARPTTVQWSEVYNALQQNVVVGAEAPLGSLWGSKLHEVRKFISMTGHFTAFVMWPINANYFNKLPADVQKLLLEEGKRAGDEMTRLTLDLQNDYMSKFKAAGVQFVTDVDINAFQKATNSVYSAFPKWTPGLHDTVLAAIRK